MSKTQKKRAKLYKKLSKILRKIEALDGPILQEYVVGVKGYIGHDVEPREKEFMSVEEHLSAKAQLRRSAL